MKRRRLVIPLMHPAAIVRGAWASEPVMIEYVRRGLRMLREGGRPLPVTEPPPNTILYPTLEDMRRWRADLDRLEDQRLSVDIESAGPHIRCIGFCRLADEAILCVRFRRQGGALWWPHRADLRAAAEWCDEVLRTYPLVFQNGQAYDVPELEEPGFEVGQYVFDTMLAQRYLYPEMPADLQFIGVFYCGLTAWKHLVKEPKEGK